MAELNLEIITPSKVIFKGDVKSITVPGANGSFQVLKNHAPIISIIDIGLVKIVSLEGETSYYATGGGTLEVNDNKVLLLADSIELGKDIDIPRAEEAKLRAEERLTNKSETTDIKRAELALRRAINRLNLVEKKVRRDL